MRDSRKKFLVDRKMLMKEHLVALALVIFVLTKNAVSQENFESNSINLPDSVFLDSTLVRKVHHSASNFKSGIANCDLDIKRFTGALLKNEEWALKVIDSSSYFIPGFLNGNFGGLGNFDECLDIRLPGEENNLWTLYSLVEVAIQRSAALYNPHQFVGEAASDFLSHLLANLKNKTIPKYAIPDDEQVINGSAENIHHGVYADNGSLDYRSIGRIELGICFPRSCGTEVPRKLAELLLAPFFDILQNSSYRLEVLPPRPDDENVGLPVKFGIADWCVTVSLAIWVTLCAISTFLDVCKIELSDSKMSAWKTHLSAFSLYTNGRNLCTIRSGGSDNYLSALDGLRVISTMSVVAAHRFILEYTLLPTTNLMDVTKSVILSWTFQIMVLSGNVAVDTFFTIGGILNAYLFLKDMKKKKKFNFSGYIIHRYLRLTPLLALFTAISATILPYIDHGPLWNIVGGEERRKCQQFWWSNILYIGNYFQYESPDYGGAYPCVAQTWYLMVDMQMYLFAIIILLPLWYCRKAGNVWLSILIALSGAIPFTIAYIYGYRGPFPIHAWGDTRNSIHYMYLTTYSRASSYLVGILTGYILYRVRSSCPDFRLRSKSIAAGWILSIVLGVSVIVGQRTLYDFERHIDVWITALYLGFHRIAWGLCIGWIVFTCATGNGGWVNTILSCYPFRLLNRFGYGIFISHIGLQGMEIGSSRTPVFAREISYLRRFVSDYILSVLVGGVLIVTFEQPLRVLENKVFKSKLSSPAKMTEAIKTEVLR